MSASRELVCTEPKHQKEIESLRTRIVHKEKLISDAISVCVSLTIRLDDFHDKEYWPRVGVYERELARLRAVFLDGNAGEEETKPRDEIKDRQARANASKSSKKRPDKDEPKRLYRKLAKLYHPDTAPNAEDKEFYHSRMAGINAAFREGDTESLRRQLKNSKAELGASGQSARSRLRALGMDEEILAGILELYASRLKNMKKSFAYNLMCEVCENTGRGIDILGRLAADLKERIQLYRDIFRLPHPDKPRHEDLPPPSRG